MTSHVTENRDFGPILARARSIPARARDFSLFWDKFFGARAARAKKIFARLRRACVFLLGENPGREIFFT